MTHKKGQLHIFRSFVALALALVIVISAAPVAFAANSGTCGDGVEWSLTGGHLTISGKGNMTNFKDDNMAPWYGSSASITKVSIGAGVKNIGTLAFYGCDNLTAAILPEGMTRIGDRAFKDCTSLPYILFPSTLLLIGESAFEGCESLRDIRLPEGLRIIRDYAFYRCSGLTTITVPASVTSFGRVVFAYCTNLTQATLHCSLDHLPDWTFYGCEKLNSVVLPETVTSSGEYAFHDCEKLETIHYTGDAAQDLMDDIRQDDSSISGSGVITTAPFEGSSSTSSDFTVDNSGTLGTTDSTAVKETEDSIITKVETTESKFQINGEDATVGEVESAGEDVDVTIESVTTSTITSTITGSNGWNELVEEVENELKGKDTEKDQVDVIVRVPETKVDGNDLAGLAGKDVVISIITPDNDVWEVDGKHFSKDSVTDKTYDFGLTVTEVKEGKTKIDSDTVFKLKFAKDVNFRVMVGVKVGNPYQRATLYEKNGNSYDDLSTVIVDRGGIAWFTFDEIRKKTDYYVGINVADKTAQDAVIPESLYNEYGLTDSTATLMDAQGNLYEITGNESAWGITVKQFGIYAGIAVAAAIVIVTLAMVTWNKIQRSKAKYRVEPEQADDDYDDDDWEPIDEEALRLEIMRELLGEMDNNK